MCAPWRLPLCTLLRFTRVPLHEVAVTHGSFLLDTRCRVLDCLYFLAVWNEAVSIHIKSSWKMFYFPCTNSGIELQGHNSKSDFSLYTAKMVSQSTHTIAHSTALCENFHFSTREQFVLSVYANVYVHSREQAQDLTRAKRALAAQLYGHPVFLAIAILVAGKWRLSAFLSGW